MSVASALHDLAGAACAVERVRLHRFRNYAEASLQLGPRVNLVGGRNAQGKTNLLEAVATVLLTRSPRAPAGDVLAWGSDEGLVEADVLRPPADRTLRVHLRREPASGRVTRVVSVDGNPRPAREVLGLCPVVLFWPEDLMLVKGEPEGRRRLLDMLLAQLDRAAAADLLRYRHVLEQRNALLRRIRSGASSTEPLAAFTAQLVDTGARVQVARAALVRQLQPRAEDTLLRLSAGIEHLSLRYLPSGSGGGEEVRAAAAQLADALAQRSEEELQRGTTLAGPHRDDLQLLIDGRSARASASQGQQRSIVLALKLAEVRHIAATMGASPVLLLDDVLSELDPDRRRDLLADLAQVGLQTLITSSEDLGGRLPAGARHYSVVNGTVRAEQ